MRYTSESRGVSSVIARFLRGDRVTVHQQHPRAAELLRFTGPLRVPFLRSRVHSLQASINVVVRKTLREKVIMAELGNGNRRKKGAARDKGQPVSACHN